MPLSLLCLHTDVAESGRGRLSPNLPAFKRRVDLDPLGRQAAERDVGIQAREH